MSAKLLLLSTLLFLPFTLLSANEIDIEALAEDQWLQLTSNDFEILTDLDEEDARILMNDLAAYRYFQQEMLGIKLVDGLPRLRVLALESTANFRHLDFPKNWGGVFVNTDDRVYAIANVNNYSSDLNHPSIGRHVLLHEYTHFLSRFSARRRNFPLWFEEGRAEYFGTFRFDGEKIYLGNPLAIAFRSNGLYNRAGQLRIDSEAIFKTKELPLKSERPSDLILIGHFYARAFYIMHYLNSSPELRQAMASYLTAVLSGKSEDEALTVAFNQSWKEFDKQAEKYVTRALTMRVISLKEGKITFPAPEITVNKMDSDRFKQEIQFFIADETRKPASED